MQKLKKQFNEYWIENLKEKEVAKKFLEFLEKNWEKWFFRENLEGHFTWSIIVVNEDITKTLLMHHKKLNKWLNFWGHADWDIDLENVAIRELSEEAGIFVQKKDLLKDFIDLQIQTIPERKNEPEHFHYDVRYVIKVPENIDFKLQEKEVNDIKWFSIKDLKEKNISPWVLKVVEKLQKKL